MTTRQAWIAIAERFEGGNSPTGLCGSVNRWYADGKITERQASKMLDRIDSYGRRKKYPKNDWWWSITPDNQIRRAKLARRFAAELKGKR